MLQLHYGFYLDSKLFRVRTNETPTSIAAQSEYTSDNVVICYILMLIKIKNKANKMHLRSSISCHINVKSTSLLTSVSKSPSMRNSSFYTVVAFLCMINTAIDPQILPTVKQMCICCGTKTLKYGTSVPHRSSSSYNVRSEVISDILSIV